MKKVKTAHVQQEPPPTGKNNCPYCWQPIIGKGFIVQRDYERAYYCSVQCHEQWGEYLRALRFLDSVNNMSDTSDR